MLPSFFAAALGVSADQDEADTPTFGTPWKAGGARSASNTSTRSPSSDATNNSPMVEAPVRNTFINFPLGRPLSMDDDFCEREVGSCPATGVRAPPGLIPWPRMPSFDELDYHNVSLCSSLLSPEPAHPCPLVHWPRTMSGECLEDFLVRDPSRYEQQPFGQRSCVEGFDVAADAVQQLDFSPSCRGSVARSFLAPTEPPHWPAAERACFAGMLSPPPAEFAPAIQKPREVSLPLRAALAGVLSTIPGAHGTAAPWAAASVPLNLAAALDNQSGTSHDVEFELGSVDMPTVGSAGHSLGTCKPCAFFHSKGCQSGVNCTFCHLCGDGEKRRRQKDLKHRLRAR